LGQPKFISKWKDLNLDFDFGKLPKMLEGGLGKVRHTYNPSYRGCGGRRIIGAWPKNKTLSNNKNLKQKGLEVWFKW
jgi:hypothetical protein